VRSYIKINTANGIIHHSLNDSKKSHDAGAILTSNRERQNIPLAVTRYCFFRRMKKQLIKI